MKKFNLNFAKAIVLSGVIMMTSVVPSTALAVFGIQCTGGTVYDTRSGLCLPPEAVRVAPRSVNDVLIRIINFGLSIAAVVAIAFLVYGGFQYMTAGLSEKNAEKGKKTILNALIGLSIIILAYVIVGTVAGSLSDFRNTWRF